MNSWFLIFLVALASLGLTYGLRKYALARSLMDIPNARSSHSVPTPRGGGVAIVLSFLVALALIATTGRLDWSASLALLGAGGFVALVGFMDDHGHIAARWRLLAHFVAAFWALGWLGGAPALQVFGVQFDLGWLGVGLVAVYLVWLLNLYNFMDGIDGLAAGEAVIVAGAAGRANVIRIRDTYRNIESGAVSVNKIILTGCDRPVGDAERQRRAFAPRGADRRARRENA